MAKNTKKKSTASRRSSAKGASGKAAPKDDMWKTYAIVLGVLLVLSVLTNGFGLGNGVGSLLNSLKKSNTGSNGELLIEEFSDFECPFCQRAYPTVKQLLDEYEGQVTFVYKHFPLSSLHPLAQQAAEASECARDQGKFEEYHDRLFETKALDTASLKKHAADLGLNTAKFNDCYDSKEKASVVQADYNEGTSRGVTGTPTFFIGGEKVVGAQPYDNLKAVIDRHLSGEAQPTPVQPTQPTQPTQATEYTSSIDDDPSKGSASAKVVIIEWSDFQCPYCSRFYSETLPSIQQNYISTGKIRFVYRDFPLSSIHPQATPAAEAAECADEQGMFWEFHNKLFENQDSLSADNYKAWAEELGMDTSLFNNCINSRKYQAEVQSDFSAGTSAGVSGTPGFLVGVIQADGKTVIGQSVRGAQPYSAFEAVIEEELAKV
ncbi:DSBA-like protein thioredoxin protein [archaeon GW2011_AR15]|nr:DSBA-like protein thioredoxin protein [archaeon GW2011_AR15]